MSELATLSPAFHADQQAISRQQYGQLLHNPARLLQLHQASSVDQFVVLMAEFIAWPKLTLEQMCVFIQTQQALFTVNGEPTDTPAPRLELAAFSQAWQPYRYCEKTKTISWVPAFRPLSDPFLEDSLSEARRCLLATFIQPVTLLAPLLAQRESVPAVAPALMIFHWSRCGSTLVSSSFAQLDSCLVLSEPVLCSQVLHDTDWPQAMKAQLVDLCLRLQGRMRQPARPTSAAKTALIVKWNAWDLAFWPLLLTLYPHSHVLCLMRQPQAILASHQAAAGRHMVRSSSLVSSQWHNDVLQYVSAESTQIAYSLGVLQHLAQLTIDLMQDYQTLAYQDAVSVLQGASSRRVVLLDYAQLQQLESADLAALLAWPLTLHELALWQTHWQFDAKQRGKVFCPAALHREASSLLHPVRHWQALLSCYQSLLVRTPVQECQDDNAVNTVGESSCQSR